MNFIEIKHRGGLAALITTGRTVREYDAFERTLKLSKLMQ